VVDVRLIVVRLGERTKTMPLRDEAVCRVFVCTAARAMAEMVEWLEPGRHFGTKSAERDRAGVDIRNGKDETI
jgi:hypothetical protein